MSDKEKMFEILKAYTKKHNIMASVVILEEYVDELIKNGCVITCINAEIERLNAVSEAELDTIHKLGEDYEKALEEINRKNAEIERLTVQKNAFAAGMKVEAEKAKEAQAEIERLKALQEQHIFYDANNDAYYDNLVSNAKSEAIKEFVKRFEKKIKDVKFTLGQTFEIKTALKTTEKEMVGDDNA